MISIDEKVKSTQLHYNFFFIKSKARNETFFCPTSLVAR